MYHPFRNCLLALAAAAAVGSGALAQDSPSLLDDPAYAATEGVTPQFVSNTTLYNADDLAKKVAKLEESLKKIEDKATDDKKKAAGRPTVEIGGRLFADLVYFTQDDANFARYNDIKNDVFFRTARLHAQGKAFEVVDYKMEFDFATSSAVYKDIYIGVCELPYVGNVRFGHYREPFALDELTSSRFITFMERPMVVNAFAPSRNIGMMLFDTTESQNASYAIGVFQEDIADNPARRNFDELSSAVTSRVTWAPWYDECTDGRGLLHTGLAYSYRDAFHETRNFRSRGDVNTGPYVVEAAFAPSVVPALNRPLRDYQLVGTELAMVYGPFSVQAEWIGAFLDPDDGSDQVYFNGAYVQTSYFLTGEHRPYRRQGAVFDRVKPYENFFRVRGEDGCVYTGKGAWEVAYRYDYVDLYDDNPIVPISSGYADAHTFGVNWYLNPYTRVMWNYIHVESNRELLDCGAMDILAMRAQIDF